MLDDDQGAEAPQEHGVHVNEVDGEDAAGLCGQELFPGGARVAGCGVDPAACRICQTVEAAIGWPSLMSSPCTRRCPRSGSPLPYGSRAFESRLPWTAAGTLAAGVVPSTYDKAPAPGEQCRWGSPRTSRPIGTVWGARIVPLAVTRAFRQLPRIR